MLVRAEAEPCWLMQGASCPSLHRLGVMKLRLGVVDTDFRSVARPVVPAGTSAGSSPDVVPSGTTSASHSGRVVDDRVEVDERVVAGGVAVAGHRLLGVVGRPDRGMAADRRLPGGDVAHVLHVGLPGQMGVASAGWPPWGPMVGVDASRVGDLAVGRHRGRGREVDELLDSPTG